jgi:hypothetical protein
MNVNTELKDYIRATSWPISKQYAKIYVGKTERIYEIRRENPLTETGRNLEPMEYEVN